MLCAGWGSAERYDADGLAFVVLRDPVAAPVTWGAKKRPALFRPSAHVIDTVWPGLLPGLPPVHRYPVTVNSPSDAA